MPRRIRPGGPFLVPRSPLDATPDQAGPSGGGQRIVFLPPFRGGGAVLWGDEELPIAAAPVALEDDSFRLSVPAGAYAPAQRALIERAEEWIASIPVDDDQRYISAFAGYARVAPFTGDDEAWMASIGTDDDQRFVSAFTGYSLVAPFIERDDDLVSSILVDDDYSWVGRYAGYPQVKAFIADDDAWMASIGVDEDSPAVFLPAVAWVLRWLAAPEDELPPQAVLAALEEEGWQGRIFVPGPISRALLGEDELPPQAAAAALEEDAWQSPLFAPGRIPRPFLGEEEWIASISLEEDGWRIAAPFARPPLRLAISEAEILAIATGLVADPRYVVRLAARGFSGAQGAREFEVDLGTRAFTSSGAARSFGTAGGARKFIVTLKAPRT